MAKNFVLTFNAGGRCMLCGRGRLEDPGRRTIRLIDPDTYHIIMIICFDCIVRGLQEHLKDDLSHDINL